MSKQETQTNQMETQTIPNTIQTPAQSESVEVMHETSEFMMDIILEHGSVPIRTELDSSNDPIRRLEERIKRAVNSDPKLKGIFIHNTCPLDSDQDDPFVSAPYIAIYNPTKIIPHQTHRELVTDYCEAIIEAIELKYNGASWKDQKLSDPITICLANMEHCIFGFDVDKYSAHDNTDSKWAFTFSFIPYGYPEQLINSEANYFSLGQLLDQLEVHRIRCIYEMCSYVKYKINIEPEI